MNEEPLSVGTDHYRVTVPDQASDTLTVFEYYKHLYPYAEVAASVSPDTRLLEVGCGAGYGAKRLADTGADVTATDGSAQAVAYARAQYPDVRFHQADGTALPFCSDTFDVVVSFQVIEHIPDDLGFLRELRRVLRPGGVVILTTPNRRLRLLPMQRPWNPYHVREYSDRTLRELTTAVFEDVRIEGVTASPDLLALERERVRPRRVVLDAVLRRMGVSGTRETPAAHREPPVSLADFFRTPETQRCIDLLCTATR